MKKNSRPKVLFVFNATTHYYNLVLNKLNENTEFEIHIAVPRERTRNVGAGVFQTEDNLKIPLYALEEKVGKYWGCYFPELLGLLWRLRPQYIVTLEVYQQGIFWNPLIFLTLKLLNIKVLFKNIPFRLPDYQSPKEVLREKLAKSEVGVLDCLKNWRTVLRVLSTKWFFSRAYDAHVCYIEKAYQIYGTYGVDPKSIFITYNSPDTDELLLMNEKAKKADPILPANPFRLIHVGRLVEWKRVDLIIRAIHLLAEKFPQIELLVLGFGPMEEPWKDLAKELHIQDRIKFVGGVYDLLLLGRYFHASQVYVLGGMGGLSINDAMSFEKPILCSVCDGTEAHLVREGENGFYFKDGDFQDLARKIEKILGSPAMARAMSMKSHSIIENEINIHRVLKGYTSAFHYAAGLGPR